MAAATFDEFRQLVEQSPEATPDVFIPIKGENGWRFTKEAVETPVVHIAGTFDVPAAKAKAKAAVGELLGTSMPLFTGKPRAGVRPDPHAILCQRLELDHASVGQRRQMLTQQPIEHTGKTLIRYGSNCDSLPAKD